MFCTRLETNAATWDVHLSVPDRGSLGGVLVLRDQERTRWVGYVRNEDGKAQALFRVTAADGVWFVDEAGKRITCRPWEHFFAYPFADALLEASKLLVITNPAGLSDAQVVSETNEIVVLRIPHGTESGIRVKGMSQEISKGARKSGSSASPWMGFPAGSAATSLADETLSIHREEGFLQARKAWKFRVEIRDFEWLSAVPTNRIPIRPTDRADRTDPYKGADWSQCVLVAHDPYAEAGANPKINSRLAVLRLDTGNIIRLPVPSFGTLFGCFLGDRQQILSTAMPLSDSTQLHEVDLRSGEVRGWEMEDFDTQPVGVPVPSPDGSRIALLCTAPNPATLLDMQFLLLEPKEGNAEWLGEPGRWGGPYSWLPDGSAIALKRFLPTKSADAMAPQMISLLRLDGTASDLRRGNDVRVLPQSKELLLRDEKKSWWITDLNGRNPRKYADGMLGWGEPAISPDGREILWVRFASNSIPTLYRFPFGETNGVPATRSSGFTSLPVW